MDHEAITVIVHLIDWRSCRGIVELHLAVIARSGATKQSTLTFLLPDGLLRGARHRARIRATRWLAMTNWLNYRCLTYGCSPAPLMPVCLWTASEPCQWMLISCTRLKVLQADFRLSLLCPLLHRYQIVVDPIDRLLVQNLAPDRHSLVEPSIHDSRSEDVRHIVSIAIAKTSEITF